MGKKKSKSPLVLSLAQPNLDPLPNHTLLHQPEAKRPTMLLVLGPHRSGTSVTTRLLQCLGAVNSHHLLPPVDGDNDKGFFEDADIYEFNERRLLPRLGQSWLSLAFTDWSRVSFSERSDLVLDALQILKHNYSTDNPLSVLKEPRISILLPFWLLVLQHAGFHVKCVCVVRDPLSVARSLQKRNGLSITHGATLYLNHWLSILSSIDHLPTFFLNFEDTLKNPADLLRSLADSLHVTLPSSFDIELFKFSTGFADPLLCHHQFSPADLRLNSHLPPLAVHLYENLLLLTRTQRIDRISKFHQEALRAIDTIKPLFLAFDRASQAPESASSPLSHLLENTPASAPAPSQEDTSLRDSLAETITAQQTQIQGLLAENQSLQQLNTTQKQQLAQFEETLSSLQTQKDRLETEQSSLQRHRDQLNIELTALRNLQAAAEQERTQLHQTIAALRTTIDRLQAERDTFRQTERENHQLKSEKEALERQISEGSAEAQILSANFTRQARELKEKTDVLDRYVRESARLAALIVARQSATDFWRARTTTTAVEEITAGARVEHGIHQHLNFTLIGLVHLGRGLSRLDARILHHHGNPGLLFFQPPAHERSFFHWTPSGEEEGRPFMAIFPGHRNGRDYLNRATTNDLLLIQATLLHVLENLVLNNQNDRNALWISQTTTLLGQLDHLPWRIHYDDILILRTDSHSQDVLVKNASYRQSILDLNVVRIKNRKIEAVLSAHQQPAPSYKTASDTEKSILDAYQRELPNILFHVDRKARENP